MSAFYTVSVLTSGFAVSNFRNYLRPTSCPNEALSFDSLRVFILYVQIMKSDTFVHTLIVGVRSLVEF